MSTFVVFTDNIAVDIWWPYEKWSDLFFLKKHYAPKKNVLKYSLRQKEFIFDTTNIHIPACNTMYAFAKAYDFLK